MSSEGYKPGLAKDQELMRLLREFQRDPRSRVFVSLAELYRRKGLIDQALEICVEGLAYHPDLSSALLVQARCYYDLRRFADALGSVATVLGQNPENLRAHKLRAEIFIRLGQRRAAMDSLQKVLQLFPQDREAQMALAELRGLEAPAGTVIAEAPHSLPKVSTGKISDFQVSPLREGLEAAGIGASVEAEPTVVEALPEKLDELEDLEEPAIATRTIAELYLRQGLRPKALAVLRKMTRENPANSWARETLQELQSSGILLPAQGKDPGKKEILERKLHYLERLLTQVKVARGA